MRRSASLVLLSLLGLTLGVIGCGSSALTGTPTAITLTPSPVSLNLGQVSTVTATITDANGSAVGGQTIEFTSSAPNTVGVSPTGLLCGGSWDSTFVHCNPGPVGTATITATASPAGLTSNGVTVYVHQKADSVVVGESFPNPVTLTCGSPVSPPSGCISSGATVPNNTERFTALACSNDPAVCGGAPPCALDPSTVGPFHFVSTNTSVATVAADVTNPNTVAVVTAIGPGKSLITANLSSTSSLPAEFDSCGPKSISIHVANQPTTTSVSIAKGATATLAADVLDINGVVLPSLPLTWTSSVVAAATVTAGGGVIGVNPGASNIVASCSPPVCNAGTQDFIASNVVVATVTGTANAATVYATSSDAGTTTIVPIDTSTHAAGTAINLPGGFAPPNSFVFTPSGATGYLGSDSGLIILDAATGATTGVTTVKGKVLATNSAGSEVLLVDTTAPDTVYLYSAATTTSYTIAGATAADFSPATAHYYIATSGGHVFEIAAGIFKDLTASGAASDVAMLANGSFAYVADPLTDVFSSCSHTNVGNVGLSSSLISAAAKPVPSPDNANLQMIAVTGNQITQIDAVPGALGNPCPDIPSNAAQSYSFPGVAAFTPVQLLVTPDSSRAIVTASDVNKLLVYTIGTDAGSGSATTIPLSGAATGAYTGGVTLNSSAVWVGVAGANQVQGFTLSSGAPIAQVSVPFSPKLVAVRYQ